MSSQSQARSSISTAGSAAFPATIPLLRDAPHRTTARERSSDAPAPGEHSLQDSLGASLRGSKLRRALVTGATGYLGGHLVEALQRRNVDVRAAVRGASDRRFLDSLHVHCIPLDWRDEQALARAVEGVDVVFHLAAAVAALSRESLYETNVGLTERLAKACASLESPPTIVYCSTIAAAGPSLRGELRTEAQAPNPISEYGRSKRGGEIALERMAGDLPATIVRPGIVVGPRCRDMLPIYQSISQFRMHFVPSFHPPKLTVVYVGDVCEILIRAAERGARLPAEANPDLPGKGIYNAASWETPTYGQLGRMIGEALGIGSPLILHLTEPLNWMVGCAGEIVARMQGRLPAVSRDKIREALASSWATSPAKAERELGITSSAPLAVRLAEVGAYYREIGCI